MNIYRLILLEYLRKLNIFQAKTMPNNTIAPAPNSNLAHHLFGIRSLVFQKSSFLCAYWLALPTKVSGFLHRGMALHLGRVVWRGGWR
jgi:hypothetical protein